TPKFKIACQIKAEPKGRDHAIAGAAFDYLLRLMIEKHADPGKIEKNPIRAVGVYDGLIRGLAKKSGPRLFLSTGGNRRYERNELKSILEIHFKYSQKHIDQYFKTGEISEEMIKSCIFLSKLDMYGLSRLLHPNLDSYEPDTVTDVGNMIELVDVTSFLPKAKCYLNPVYGIGSLIWGSDGDLL